jgi:DNA helicase-2/ATP-dependent DNA helicase PcrA
MKNILDELNPVQRAAAEQIDGPSLIIAGAGSGKTRVLTYKIANMLMHHISPEAILALTFTNKAAREMKDRIATVVGKQADRLWMGTFHSIFSRILRFEAAAIGFKSNFTIYDSADSASLLRSIVKEMQLDEKTYRDKLVHNRISMAKNNLVTASSYTANTQLVSEDVQNRCPKIAGIYQQYAARCRNANAMDFDDLLLYTNILFRDNLAILRKYQHRFRYVLVDEYQDTNIAQYVIVKRLSELHNNITVVGDDAQSIYSFRGARIENILNFRRDYPNYKQYKLEQNYRSTQTIVNAANDLIAKNKSRLPKQCFSAGKIGEKIELIKAFTDQEEGVLVASSIVDTIYGKQAKYSDIAILYRTNAQSRIFEDSLRKRNIPYKIYGGMSFYQRAEIKDTLAYLRLCTNTSDNEAFKRIINYPARGIGAVTLERMQAQANHHGLSLWEAVNKLPHPTMGIKETTSKRLGDFIALISAFAKRVNSDNAYDFAMGLVKQSGILAELKSDKSAENIARLENIEELLNSIKQYGDNMRDPQEDGKFFITEYLQSVSLLTDFDGESHGGEKVSLMTMHASKGLEFPYVYIVGMEEGLFPNGQLYALSEAALEEERRLFYVAITRASVKVTLSFAQARYNWGKATSPRPSRFLNDISSTFMALPEAPVSKMTFIRKTPLPVIPDYNLDEPVLPKPVAADLQPGTEVEHGRFGKGVIKEMEDNYGAIKVKIDFYDVGTKVLLLKFTSLKVIKK